MKYFNTMERKPAFLFTGGKKWKKIPIIWFWESYQIL